MTEFLLVGAGGVLGAWARHLLGERIDARTVDTLAVNVAGSLLLGLLLALPGSEAAFLVVGVGFCGAFTTFSTFAFETVRQYEEGDRRRAVGDAAVTLFAALLAVVAGLWVGEFLVTTV